MSDNLPTAPAPEGNKPLVSPHLSPQIIEQLVSNQARDLELRAADLALQQQKDNNGFTYAMKALDAQVSDRKDARLHRCRMKDRLFIFSGIMAFLVGAVIVTCLCTNHEAVALEMIKLIAYVGVGVFGGYGFGKRHGKDQSAEENPNSESAQ